MFLSISYYFAIYLPYKERSRRNAVQNCLQFASDKRDSNWLFQCDKIGLKGNCGLPKITAETVEKDYQQYREECYKL